jgi:hypothetical protein
MIQSSIRIKAALKRRVLRAIDFQPALKASVYRKDKELTLRSEKISVYSESSLLSIPDPRNGQLVGHFFQEREILRLLDVILEPHQGFVYDKDGNLVSESTTWNSCFANICFPWRPGRAITNLKVSNAIPLTSNSYWHWLEVQLERHERLCIRIPILH